GFGHVATAAQGTYGTTGPGIQQVARGQHGQQHTRPDEQIHAAAASEGHAQYLQKLYARNAIVLPQKAQIAKQVIQGQAPNNNADGQEVAGQAQSDGTQQPGKHPRDGQTRQQAEPGRPRQCRRQIGSRVG